MDIEINEVQEIIKNLESNSEISIKEEKYLKVAKLCVQLAAENVAMNDRTLLAERALGHNKTLLATEKQRANEYCGELNYKNQLLDMLRGDIKIYQTRAEKIHVEAEEIRVQRDELAAENVAMKAVFSQKEIPSEAVDAFMETAVMDHDWNETSEWSWVENETEVIHAVLDALKPEATATDAYLAGIKADGVAAALESCSDYLDTDCVMDRLDISYEDAKKRTSGAIEFHDAMVNFANQLREGADK